MVNAKDIELINTTIATLFKTREYAKDFKRYTAVRHLDELIKGLQEFEQRLKKES
ncbi:hypothetical protein [Campylobacter upsaliensis]|uniref:hypothetical protein n=1 Tax=Campylobacter upsaliensis TaxID=28080 RepID=UPI0018F06ABE|nr:hypothetical protein [Campylobacter upsaliensis]MBJ6809589.1 hypothetical protein [Campylobacter upsaliensis]